MRRARTVRAAGSFVNPNTITVGDRQKLKRDYEKERKKNLEKICLERAPIDIVFKLASIGCTKDEIIKVLPYGSVAFHYDEYKEAFERGTSARKMSLRHKQYQVALRGNVAMLIWLGKQDLDQRDRTDGSDPKLAIPLNVSINFVKTENGTTVDGRVTTSQHRRELPRET